VFVLATEAAHRELKDGTLTKIKGKEETAELVLETGQAELASIGDVNAFDQSREVIIIKFKPSFD
jgi:hypothetical protein